MNKEKINTTLDMIVGGDQFKFYGLINYLSKEENAKECRQILLETERRIKQIAGREKDMDGFLPLPGTEERDALGKLLMVRKCVLDVMLEPTENEVTRLEKQNEKLFQLTKEMERRTNLMGMIYDDTTHKTDEYYWYEIEGTLRYMYDDKVGIFPMAEDNFYGSDFKYMNRLLAFMDYHDSAIVSFEYGDWPMDNGKTWADVMSLDSAFDHICFCYAVQAICNEYYYSIPDLLRMNNFVINTHIKYESTDEDYDQEMLE